MARTFTLGRYTCVERLGGGPAGETWRAKRFGLVGLERQVVVHKVGPALAKDAAALGRLATALKSYGELDSSALLRLVEFSSGATEAFSVWEFPGFADLRKLRTGLAAELEKDADQTLWPALVGHIGRTLSSALALAHQAGLWHGLLSPAVIWLVPDGSLRISELGFAPLLPASAWGQDATIKTLASYVPPEVLSGSVPAGPENDIFALGVILGELLTQSPSGSSTLATALREIADRARTTTRSQRFASMTELAAALASLPASEGLENSAQATLIRQALGRVAEQYQLAGDTVPQVVTISERSSAEPLPPPPGKSGDNKIAVSARNRISNLGEPSGKTAAREPSKPAAAQPATAVPRSESEDTPLPQSRPLLLTNPKIPAPETEADSKGAEAAGAATASTAANKAASGTPASSSAAGGRKSGKHRSGIDWLTSQSDSVPTEAAKNAEAEAVKKPSLPPRPPSAALKSPSAPPKGAKTAAAAKDSGPTAQVGRSSNPPGQAAGGRRSNPVSVNPKARPASSAAASANTPTADQQVALAGAAAPDKAGSSDAWGRAPDTLSFNETSPALAPVKLPGPAGKSAPQPPPADSSELLAKATAALSGAPAVTEQAGTADAASAPTEAATADETAADKGKRRSGPISEPNSRVLSSTAPAEIVQIAEGLAQVDAERASAQASQPVPAENPAGIGDPALAEPSALDPSMIRPSGPPILVIVLGVVALIAIIVVIKLSSGSGVVPVAVLDGSVAGKDGGSASAGGSKDPAQTGLVISSTPKAQIYLDGADKGSTPQTLKPGAGNHKLLLVAEGYKLLRRDVSESGKLELKLDAARLPEDIQGPAELKVKCKTEGKLRIIVDGHDSGMACPTETLSVSPGKHTLTFVNVADGSLNEKKLKVKKGKKPTKLKVKF